ncbi:MAG: PqqD family peptide modification chaperone [Pyrinomonadaceae bacterium]
MLPRVRKNDLLIESTDTDLLIFDCLKNEGINLNETSALIWKKCDGTRSPWQIQKELCSELNAVITEEMVWNALLQFKDKGLLIDDLDREDTLNAVIHSELTKKIRVA